MKLYRFRYSPYARKVQIVLDWLAQPYELVEASYGDRNELATVTGGYIYVPVLVTDAGRVLTESRDICEHLLSEHPQVPLAPAPLEGPVWAYHDWVDTSLEDVLFRIASPSIQRAWPTPGERALYTLIKERKFGAGCVDAWYREREALTTRAQKLLGPTLRTLSQQPFLFGNRPTLADAALYGNCVMLQEGVEQLLPSIASELLRYVERCEAASLR